MLLQQGVSNGCSLAMCCLGQHYYRKVKDFDRALPLLEKAAFLGEAEAMNELGVRYHHLDPPRAQKLYEPAVEQGHPMAMGNLSLCLLKQKQNLEYARQLLLQARRYGVEFADRELISEDWKVIDSIASKFFMLLFLFLQILTRHCSSCTLLNPITNRKCSACSSPIPEVADLPMVSSLLLIE